MITSNINIISNIYIRTNSDITKDRPYTQKISGVKRLRDIKNRYFGFESIPLTDVQHRILRESAGCAGIRNGEKAYGPILVNGELQWVNRCENDSCPVFADCLALRSPHDIIRNATPQTDTEEQKNLEKFFDFLGIRIEDNQAVFERDKNTNTSSETEESETAYTEPTEQKYSNNQLLAKQYTEISEPGRIIESPLDSHIILNSGPGSGKSYTIIQRLIYLLKNELCPAEQIYILCYTRSAKNVIVTKIDEAVSRGDLLPSAQNICILTFDSYATYFLMAMKEQNVISDDLSSLNYNQRIALFNQHISAEDFEDVRYFIVDEIQDLVNERAQMVLNILTHLRCGYLLAGDRCQSIYDFEADADATLDSVHFYEKLEALFPEDIQRYEIVGNKRQTTELAQEANELRHCLLHDSIAQQNRYANTVIKKYEVREKIESFIQNLQTHPIGSTAILCRTNGEAEYISSLLYSQKIPHNLNRGVNNYAPLPRWIADVFWDFCSDTISREEFLERFQFRCHAPANASEIWDYFCKITEMEHASSISMQKLIVALAIEPNLPETFYGIRPLLTVSTIHKAKGSEFDYVILISSEIDLQEQTAEEARIRYVALTRPRKQLQVMKRKRHFFKRIVSGRVIEKGYHNYLQQTHSFCGGIAVGMNGDIDSTSFVSGELSAILNLQEYIIHNVKQFDPLTAERKPDSDTYDIYHYAKQIGTLSSAMVNELLNGIKATDYHYNLPVKLENLFVRDITAEILKESGSSIPLEYRKSRICYGIQITGLAKLRFEKKG